MQQSEGVQLSAVSTVAEASRHSARGEGVQRAGMPARIKSEDLGKFPKMRVRGARRGYAVQRALAVRGLSRGDLQRSSGLEQVASRTASPCTGGGIVLACG